VINRGGDNRGGGMNATITTASLIRRGFKLKLLLRLILKVDHQAVSTF
jgi:hypothetical protein